jgi:hypothetical protein
MQVRVYLCPGAFIGFSCRQSGLVAAFESLSAASYPLSCSLSEIKWRGVVKDHAKIDLCTQAFGAALRASTDTTFGYRVTAKTQYANATEELARCSKNRRVHAKFHASAVR